MCSYDYRVILVLVLTMSQDYKSYRRENKIFLTDELATRADAAYYGEDSDYSTTSFSFPNEVV